MQLMIMTSVIPCHALPAPQHAAVSPFGPLNHNNDFLRLSCRSRLYFTGTGKSRYAGFCVELPTELDCRPELESFIYPRYCYTDSVNSFTEAVTCVLCSFWHHLSVFNVTHKCERLTVVNSDQSYYPRTPKDTGGHLRIPEDTPGHLYLLFISFH